MRVPPAVEVSAAAGAAIAARHGIAAPTLARLDHSGTSNTIYLLGGDYVLRVPRDDPARAAGVAAEAVAVAAARAAGVRTPRLVALDDTRDLLPVPYAIYERVPGIPLDRAAHEPANISEVWRELGRDLARLHANVRRDSPAGGLPDQATDPDPRPWLDALVAAELMLPDEARWLRAWLGRLERYARAPIAPRFCHGDVNAGNVMVAPGAPSYLALLDWGGAGWGDAAWDFVPVALPAVPLMLEGYRAVAPLEGDDTAEARILWHHIQLMLFTLRHGPPRERAWVARRLARLRDAIDIFLAAPRASWMANHHQGADHG